MKKFVLAISLAGGVAAMVVLYFFDPVRVPFYPVCQFHQLTGLDCPGCGSLRAMHELLHGHVVSALHFNPLIVLSLPLFGMLAVRLFWRRTAGQYGLAIRTWWLWVYLIVWIGFGIVRNLPVQPFAAFAP